MPKSSSAMRKVLDQRALGDLDNERGRRQADFLDQGHHALDQVQSAELQGGEVHRHGQVLAAHIVPGLELVRGGFRHPIPESIDQAGMFRNRDENVRSYQTTLGVLPTQQRLEAEDAAFTQVDTRLVLEIQFAAVQGMCQLCLRLQLLPGAVVHRLAEEQTNLALTNLPRLPQSGGCVRQQIVRIVRIVGIDTDTDMRIEEDLASIDLHHFFQQAENALHDPGRGFSIMHVG